MDCKQNPQKVDMTAPRPAASPVSFERHGAIGVLRVANPPVNALSPVTVTGLIAGLAAFEADASLLALVVHAEGRTFVAGGDIASFDLPDFSAAPYNSFLARLEAGHRPVVALLHGTPLGGGLELAMACHHRLALASTRLGLPEVKLGLIPGSLGTQRLPRLVGAALALDLMQSGRMISAPDALAAGLVDALIEPAPAASVDEGLLQAGLAAVRAMLAAPGGVALRRSSEQVAPGTVSADFFAKAHAAAAGKPQYPALAGLVRCAEAAVTLPFAAGEAVEAGVFAQVLASPASAAMRHLFFAEREAGKIPGLAKDLALRTIARVGIVGAGTMGGGIAMNFANVGLPVVLVEASAEALARGLGLVRANYEATAAKGRLSSAQVEQRMSLLQGSTDFEQLADCDLVIEAVFEDMALKKVVAARLGRICKPGAIIATNTSTLDVDAIAEASGRPADVLGTHFFSPANVMRLLEVVRGAKTAPEVLATVMKLAGRIQKVAAVSGVCYGFIGNRMVEPYMRETEYLLMEGANPAQIDAAIEGLGLAMGPCRMLDMAGIDVGAKTVIERGLADGLPDDPSYRALCRKLFELGRFGQKTGAGYYRYEGRKPLPDPELARISVELAAVHGIARRSDIGNAEIIERLMYPLINEGALILEEGIAYRPGDIDVIWTAGYGFPDHRGGPIFMADAIGLPAIVEALQRYGRRRGDAYGYWRVAPLLERCAREGRRLGDKA